MNVDIQKLAKEDLKQTTGLYRAVTSELRGRGIRQWGIFYPNRFILARDLATGALYGLKEEGLVLGAVVIDRKQAKSYNGVSWQDAEGTPAVIHRLAVHPRRQGQGLGGKLLRFAEAEAEGRGCTSVRLDVYAANEAALGMYERKGYVRRGEISYPLRDIAYYCYEKCLRA
ncbi:GNAT family N-acetyltransferase [Paenibacillus filicis]|uniref:GNAT family N-acetyltransferase n=1 Tax=Paenibacillus filicis TaxID=669464 RepID=A0ABU9DVM8_9BACL